jgi:2-polyprenyl-3-methyl-5-hydroxy-6-metoxy-1,4-benzoquinol methylase
VDFGAGTGSMLSALGDARPDALLFAIEPKMPASADRRLHYLEAFSEIRERVDLVTAFEVCEHLSDQDVQQFLHDAKDALNAEGKLIISVPIMLGGAFLLKKMNHLIFRRQNPGSIAVLMKATLGGKVPRAPNRWNSHDGFDFRLLRREISQFFVIEKEIHSPLHLPWWASSQVFFICRK